MVQGSGLTLSQRGDTLVATAEVVCSCPDWGFRV